MLGDRGGGVVELLRKLLTSLFPTESQSLCQKFHFIFHVIFRLCSWEKLFTRLFLVLMTVRVRGLSSIWYIVLNTDWMLTSSLPQRMNWRIQTDLKTTQMLWMTIRCLEILNSKQHWRLSFLEPSLGWRAVHSVLFGKHFITKFIATKCWVLSKLC